MNNDPGRGRWAIPVIDLFAGPGGLSEGFSSFQAVSGRPAFRVRLSIERDRTAHRTLELRSFVRQFDSADFPDDYYEYLRGAIAREVLFERYPPEALRAQTEAWCAELGSETTPDHEIDNRITLALAGATNWVLIGGPPCQAYSLVGRSRMRGGNPDKFESDPRHYLYRHYLRILAKHRPPVFVMENVKGLLSASAGGEPIFRRILRDLKCPGESFRAGPDLSHHGNPGDYRLYPLVSTGTGVFDDPPPGGFIVRSECYGIPQARHRIFIVGVRADIKAEPGELSRARNEIPVEKVISDLPRLRSALSEGDQSGELWVEALREVTSQRWFQSIRANPAITAGVTKALERTKPGLKTGGNFIAHHRSTLPAYRPEWYSDERIEGVCNHQAKTHMREDLHRYLFAAVFSEVTGRSPVLEDFPRQLLPRHDNVRIEMNLEGFADRFRVQRKGRPATTITSHLSKDGHYFIHYDPSQCRSLTVREAARIQTFPDNYFFEGNKTEQYVQVGNAVPPLLAQQIAACIARVFGIE